MDAQTNPNVDEAIRSFVEKLKSVRRSGAERPDEEIRETLKQVVRTEMRDLPEAEAGRRLDGARDFLVAEARRSEQRVEGLETEVGRLKAQAESLRAERDRLAEENRRMKAAPQTVAGGPGLEGALSKIRDALLQITQDREVTSESLALPPSEARFFRLIRELLVFALNFETGVHDLIQKIQVMRFGQNSMMVKQQKKIIRNRFRACLDNEEGSVVALKEALDRNKAFLISLYEAYNASIREGSRSLLEQLDPQTILDQTKGMLLDRFEKAWRAFSDQHADLSTLPETDLWERFFDAPFKHKMQDYLDPGAARA